MSVYSTTSRKDYTFKFDKHVIIMVGNIGSGKSTFVKSKDSEYVIVSKDAMRYNIGNGNYVFLKEFEPAISRSIITLYEELLKSNVNIIVDETNMLSRIRAAYILPAKEQSYKITAVVMPKIDKDLAIQRRMQHPHGNFSDAKERWEQVWNTFDTYYQEPTINEGFDDIIRL
jgi:predicted kinase